MINAERVMKIAKCRNNRKQIILYKLELSRRLVLAPTMGRNVIYRLKLNNDRENI